MPAAKLGDMEADLILSDSCDCYHKSPVKAWIFHFMKKCWNFNWWLCCQPSVQNSMVPGEEFSPNANTLHMKLQIPHQAWMSFMSEHKLMNLLASYHENVSTYSLFRNKETMTLCNNMLPRSDKCMGEFKFPLWMQYNRQFGWYWT